MQQCGIIKTSPPAIMSISEDLTPITFTRNDLEEIDMPYIDPLVVTLEIANITIKRIFIDRGKIRLMTKGIINLPVKARDKIVSVNFLVVNAPSAYNEILGSIARELPDQNSFWVIGKPATEENEKTVIPEHVPIEESVSSPQQVMEDRAK
ncbi:hypothetical protein WN944_014776 [Citrus x changshan-huyou]|uniref:Uncharacterized protein n=1 Tax=Citrus x changshan-huyou TaxID=2935761 RepID=A0AAP0M6D2_9ROSI